MAIKLAAIAFGVRHQRSFRVGEIAGTIVDEIVNETASPFHREIYTRTEPLTDGIENRGRVLLSEQRDSTLSIDIDQVVYESRADALEEAMTTLKEEIAPYISKKIFTKHEIENISRLGVVFTFVGTGTDVAHQITDGLTKKSFTKPEHFALRFSQKGPALASMIKKDIQDYTNAIITVQKRDNEMIYKFDFQLYYSPEIENMSDVDVTEFLNSAQSDLQKSFLPWISTEMHDKKTE